MSLKQENKTKKKGLVSYTKKGREIKSKKKKIKKIQ